MRYTVVDRQGTVSFVAHDSAKTALTAACAENPATLVDLLRISRTYDRGLCDLVLNGLAVFDEHNLPDHLGVIHQQLATLAPRDIPVFRVLDEVTREDQQYRLAARARGRGQLPQRQVPEPPGLRLRAAARMVHRALKTVPAS
jgi:hypothetical protein